jgi:tetratricopeptide (TPR) repeat protein
MKGVSMMKTPWSFYHLAPLALILLLAPEALSQRVTHDLRGPGGIQVSVRSADQRDAINGADVSLVAAGRAESVLSGFTDASGRISFTGVNPGAYEIVVRKEGYEASRERAIVGGMGRETFFIVLHRSGAAAVGRASTVAARPAVPEAARKAYDEGVASLQADPAKSVEHFRRAIKEFPEFAEAYTMLGYAELRRGEKAEAVAALSKAVELNPELAQAQLLLGKIYLDDNKPQEAEKPLRQSVKLDPKSSEAHLRLAHCLHLLKKPDEALSHARRALELPNASPLTHLLIAEIHESRNERKEALEALEKFVKADPQNPLMPRVRQKMEGLRAGGEDR